MVDTHHLVADIGGTNARFALIKEDNLVPSHITSLKARDHHGLSEAIEAYLSGLGLIDDNDHRDLNIASACVAVACPVSGDQIKLTNNDWQFSIEQIRASLGLETLMVVNDFKALAMSLPHLEAEDKIQIGGGEAQPQRPITVIGPGTGLGVATIIATNAGYVLIDGEGGHVGFAPETETEIEILRVLLRRYDRVSCERILSGDGLETLHAALAEIDGFANQKYLSAPEIVERAKANSISRCRRTIDVFCGILGSLAGDLALSQGSRGGVYIGGGIIPRFADLFVDTPFRKRFESKGRMGVLNQKIPTYLITASDPALIGAAHLLKGG